MMGHVGKIDMAVYTSAPGATQLEYCIILQQYLEGKSTAHLWKGRSTAAVNSAFNKASRGRGSIAYCRATPFMTRLLRI